jgi:hypothetical protein
MGISGTSRPMLIAALSLAVCLGCARAARLTDGRSDDAGKGKVYGEFEDSGLLAVASQAAPEMASWSEKEVMDGLSGATIQAKTLGPKVGRGEILVSGKKVAFADGFGQYWVALSPGIYTFTGRCRGYHDASVRVEVKSGEDCYANFYLRKK